MKFWVTIFDDVFAKFCRGEDMTVDELAALIKNTRAPKKSDLPLLKFAHFGPLRTPTTARRWRWVTPARCKYHYDERCRGRL